MDEVQLFGNRGIPRVVELGEQIQGMLRSAVEHLPDTPNRIGQVLQGAILGVG